MTGSHRKGSAERGQRVLFCVLCEGLQPHRAVIPHTGQRFGNNLIIDLTGARLTPARIVGYLHLTNEGQASLTPSDQIAFAYLCVIEIKIDA